MTSIQKFYQLALVRFKRNPFFFIRVYLPALLYIITYLIPKARSLTFFTMVNPGLKLSGMIAQSKYQLNQQFPKKYTAKAILLEKGATPQLILATMQQNNLFFPIILKPDLGERGIGVVKINNKKTLDNYLIEMKDKQLILEEFIQSKEEYALLYYRLPHQEKGKILSFARKRFLAVTGDGQSTLKELIQKDVRFRFHRRRTYRRLATELQTVLPKNQEKRITELGNCSDGIVCENLNSEITAVLENKFDQISQHIDGFYFGRFDIRANKIEDLLQDDFKIIELNGVNSLPIHIYDTKMPIRNCFLDMTNTLDIIYTISQQNKQLGCQPVSSRQTVLTMMKSRYSHLSYMGL